MTDTVHDPSVHPSRRRTSPWTSYPVSTASVWVRDQPEPASPRSAGGPSSATGTGPLACDVSDTPVSRGRRSRSLCSPDPVTQSWSRTFLRTLPLFPSCRARQPPSEDPEGPSSPDLRPHTPVVAVSNLSSRGCRFGPQGAPLLVRLLCPSCVPRASLSFPYRPCPDPVS